MGGGIETDNASVMLVAADQDSRTGLCERMISLGVKSQRALLPVDLMWSVSGRPVMGDLKTPIDMIASAKDGRLHQQITAMQKRDPLCLFFLIEGQPWGDGIVIGDGTNAWSIEKFDNLLASVQSEGAMIFHSMSQARTPQRLASLYAWLSKENHGSWHRPVKAHPTLHQRYTDRTWRKCVELVMAMQGVGEQTANDLIDRLPMWEIFGTTPEQLNETHARWVAVKGIGDKTAKVALSLLREDFSAPVLVRTET